MITTRELTRAEIDAIWTIDRSEVIDGVYVVVEGELVLRSVHEDVQGWPSGEAERLTPTLRACFDRGGWFLGAFDGASLVGVVVLDTERLGAANDQLQLKILYVSRSQRGTGLGCQLFERARETARARGARRLYISATPSRNTVDFYRARDCTLIQKPDEALYALEPEDIHLECSV